MRSRYWSCSKFADWIRGTGKLKCGTSTEWREWRRSAESQHPIRYWIAEEGLDYVQNFVNWIPDQLYAIKYYINNRWVTRTHALTANPRDIKPGTWMDVGNRFLPCLFNELVDFVEIELAWWHIAWESAEVRKKYRAPFWATGWFRWRNWRCPEAGLDNLAWQMTLTNADFLPEDQQHLAEPTRQAINAREILELYRWWTETYRNRPDPYDVSGWTEHCEKIRQENGGDLLAGLDRDDYSDTKPLHDKIHELEEQYRQEDTTMLKRLIDIRDSLWT